MRTLVLMGSAMLMGMAAEAQVTPAPAPAPMVDRERRVEIERDGERVALRRAMMDDTTHLNRATLGVTLGGATGKRDTLGIFIAAVAENGPAERAGIYEGYRIAAINGIDLRATRADADDPYLANIGRHRLTREMERAAAGRSVSLRIWTGSGWRDVTVTAGRYGDVYQRRMRTGFFQDGGGVRVTSPAFGFEFSPPHVRSTSPGHLMIGAPHFEMLPKHALPPVPPGAEGRGIGSQLKRVFPIRVQTIERHTI